MKSLSPALETEQKKPLRRPVVELACRRYEHPARAGGGQTAADEGIQWGMFDWKLLYSNAASPSCHGVTIPADGSLNRIALSGSAVLHQRVAAPGPGADFGAPWNTVLNLNLAGVCAVASFGQEVMVFAPVHDGSHYLQYKRSNDNGQSFSSPVTVHGSNAPVHAIAACARNNGYWGIVSSHSSAEGLCIDILRNSDRLLMVHSFHPASPSVYGLAMYFDGDWNIVALEQSGTALHLKRYVFGAGYRVAANAWTTGVALDLGSARVDQPSLLMRYLERQEPYSDFGRLADEYEYFTMFKGKTYPAADLRALRREQRHQVFQPSRWDTVSSILTARATDNLDVDAPFICGTGESAVLSLYKMQQRWFYRLRPGSDFYDAEWDRAERQQGNCLYGMALACHDGYLWGTRRNEIWRCRVPGDCWDLPEPGSGPAVEAYMPSRSRILQVRQVVRAHSRSELFVTLDNSQGEFSQLPSASICRGARVELAIGYRCETEETVPAGHYFVEGWSYCSGPARSTVILHCVDGWGLLEHYTVAGPAEFNVTGEQTSVYMLLERLAASIGGTLTYRSRSSLVTSLCPRLEVRAGENGAELARRLLALVPDVLFFNGTDAVMVHPRADDEAGYSIYCPYPGAAGGGKHYLLYGTWGPRSGARNRVMVVGTDREGNHVAAAAVDEADISLVGERLDIRMQPAIVSQQDALNAASTILGRERMEHCGGYIVLAPHCGIELWDVIALHAAPDAAAGTPFRVCGYELLYDAPAGVFRQKLELSAV